MDWKIRETVQREIYLKEEVQALYKKAAIKGPEDALSDKEKALLKDWERDLEALAKAYWEYERKLYHVEVSAPSWIAQSIQGSQEGRVLVFVSLVT